MWRQNLFGTPLAFPINDFVQEEKKKSLLSDQQNNTKRHRHSEANRILLCSHVQHKHTKIYFSVLITDLKTDNYGHLRRHVYNLLFMVSTCQKCPLTVLFTILTTSGSSVLSNRCTNVGQQTFRQTPISKSPNKNPPLLFTVFPPVNHLHMMVLVCWFSTELYIKMFTFFLSLGFKLGSSLKRKLNMIFVDRIIQLQG